MAVSFSGHGKLPLSIFIQLNERMRRDLIRSLGQPTNIDALRFQLTADQVCFFVLP